MRLCTEVKMDSECEDGSVVKLKRERKPEEWKVIKAKRLKAQGLPYINKKGEHKPARVAGDKCRYLPINFVRLEK